MDEPLYLTDPPSRGRCEPRPDLLPVGIETSYNALPLTPVEEVADQEFKAALAFVAQEGMVTTNETGRKVVEWLFTDRDRALLALTGFPLSNHRGLRLNYPE